MTVGIREAQPDDAKRIVELIADLGHVMTEDEVRARIDEVAQSDVAQIVAVADDTVIGLCGLHIMTVIYRPKPVGRITILAVAGDYRGQGIGRALVGATETRLREAGCGLIEVTSNERLADAHAFYRRIGFDQTSKRFAKILD